MSRKISFDDADCNRILRMPRGARRDAAMAAFVQGALAETAEAYGEAFKASMDRFADDLLADIDEVKAALDEQVADMKKVYEAQLGWWCCLVLLRRNEAILWDFGTGPR